MTYPQTLEYLYNSTPVYENVGAGAYKPGLANMEALDEHLNHPHRSYMTIHVAGTNGKGSVCHTLAAVLQSAGYKVGLYTSPHLLDFRERIRIDGQKISEEYVVDFVKKNKDFFEPLHPSFFEVVTALAFDYFRSQKVDIAVIEVGLGGRLDSTNVISPILSVITNIGLDHTAQLGNTLEQIAYEKAGIIKERVPVVIGEIIGTEEDVIIERAEELDAPLYAILDGDRLITSAPIIDGQGRWMMDSVDYGILTYDIQGAPQLINAVTVLCALRELDNLLPRPLTPDEVADGFENVSSLTGLRARWECLRTNPTVIADVAHNPDAWGKTVRWLKNHKRRYTIILGFCSDKDVNTIMNMLPKDMAYVFTAADTKRAIPAADLLDMAVKAGLNGKAIPDVKEAVRSTLAEADKDDFILISGSHFVVAEALAYMKNNV